MRQTMGLPESAVPMTPLASVRTTESLSFQEMIQFTGGLDADYFLGKGDYLIFIQKHLAQAAQQVPPQQVGLKRRGLRLEGFLPLVRLSGGQGSRPC